MGDNDDQEMRSATSYSKWEFLNPNDDPHDRFNCFMTTAAGLLELNSLKQLASLPNISQNVRDALKAHENSNIDKRRGAYLCEIIEFYKDIGINYINNEFNSKSEVMEFLETRVKVGEKKKFALAFHYNEQFINAINISRDAQTMSHPLGHIVAVKIDKTRSKHIFRVHDFQISRGEPGREIKDQLPVHAEPPLYLFEKEIY